MTDDTKRNRRRMNVERGQDEKREAADLWDDVDTLRELAGSLPGDLGNRLKPIAARLAAYLPPRQAASDSSE